MSEDQFTFEISLSVLNHLGRNLYRSFLTVLGEAISNSWDADAENVRVYIDRDNSNLAIKDDGAGMDEDDFQNKFLKIGYSKRKDKGAMSGKDRPFIGRKGIGKLALLSCADQVTVVSKKPDGECIGGVIDNSKLDQAITEDLTPQEYALEEWDEETITPYIEGFEKGTIIHFKNIKDGIRNTVDYLKKTIAMYFRFSLLDDTFTVFVDDEEITYDHLDDLAQQTEFLWNINELEDPYVNEKLTKPPLKEDSIPLQIESDIKGFIATVVKPRNLKIVSTEEKASVDLFVNGRLREKNILRHIPTTRIPEDYMYGQIHFNDLDDQEDRFTSSRENIVADDPKYKAFLDDLKKNVIYKIIEEWDELRVKHKKEGDSENTRISKKERKSKELFDTVSEEYIPPETDENKERVDGWVDALRDDAQFNFGSYAECFISENLVRHFIVEESIDLSEEAENQVETFRKRESDNKGKGDISIDIRREDTDLSFLSMDDLANLVDKKDPIKEACLSRDAKQYKPLRDAIAHTALLTDVAKDKLTSVYENIKGRVKNLLLKKEG